MNLHLLVEELWQALERSWSAVPHHALVCESAMLQEVTRLERRSHLRALRARGAVQMLERIRGAAPHHTAVAPNRRYGLA